jgi:hypothetical protein
MPAALDKTQALPPPGLGKTLTGEAPSRAAPTAPGQAPPPAGQTQAGFAAPHAAPPAPAGAAGLKATVMGLGALPAPPPAGEAPRPAPLGLKGTMIGLAPAALQAAQPPAPAQPAVANPLRGTMIGMAPPPAPFNPDVTTPSPLLSPHAVPPEAANLPVPHKTMLGIARPGIAPLNPGVEKPKPLAPPPPAAAPLPELPVAQPWRPAPPAAAPGVPAGVPRPLRIPAGAAVAIVGAAALLAAAGVALFLYRARGAVEATLGTNADGKDQLSLVCKGCADGATVRVGNARGTFHGGRADVLIEQKLAVGNNTVAAELERRPGHADAVELSVPVDFRIRADTSGLSQAPPRVVVRVEAVPHAAVVVDGKPLALAPAPGGSETGSAELDVSSALLGNSSVVSMLERKIPYVVTPPSGAPARGEVSVRIGVTPLVVSAPGPSITIETQTFVLAGHTQKDATVTVEGRPITVDGTGAFAQMMSVSALGETNVTVRADAKDQAPRLVPVRVRRVENLAAQAALARATATSAYSALEADPEARRGLAVALDGSVVEARVDAFTSVLLMDVKSGCSHAPCLARVTIGEKAELKPGSGVSVFGVVSGAVEGPHQGTKIPAIAADFVLKGRP